MTLQVTLVGGPPWGLRVSHDEELRPVVAKLIPAGRADSAGLRIGDLIEEVNDNPVVSTSQAQTQIQESKGELRLRVGRSSAGYHATVAREKLSNSLQGSPIAERKFPSHQNPSLQPRTNPNFRQIRLDVQGVKGTADSKRRMFEQLSAGKPPPPATDRLLQRKIQMGFHAGVPSESTTGYGSVGGDFAGGASGRTTPMSSILAEEDERTLHEDALRLPNGIPEEMHPTEMRIESPGPSQWAMKTETHSVAPADGTVEVPRPRSVAALRQALTDKLELKSPSGSTPTEGRRTPSSWSNVRVFEGIEEDPSKPVFGRVLDGPVAPEKYFQGVPPPSYNWTSQASSSVTAPVSPAKPPVPPPSIPPKPPKPSVEHDFNGNISSNGARNSFLNNIAARAEEMEPSPTYSDDFGRGLYYDNSYGRSPMEESSMTRSTTTTTTETEQPVEPAQSVEPPEDPTSIPSGLWPSRGSMDLESRQLLKSKSPSPYSSGTADHYATIRRAPTPVKVEVLEPQVERKPYSSSTTNDSGYGDALSPRDTLGFDCYSMGSTMPASSADQTIDTLSIESSRPERPESLISTETDAPPPLRPVSNEPEMASWYRDMFKKMHKIELSDPGRPSPSEGSPSAVSTISRPHTPTTLVSRPPSRFECEITPRRARSVGRVIEPEKEASPAPAVAEEIAELKRLSKEEIMLRQKAERLQEELEEQRQRRHGYLPSSAPSLQKNMDRFEGLMNEYCKEASPSRNSPANVIRTATAVYGFAPKSARELPLNKGDIVRIHRQIDSNWLEGERNGKSGIFPASYVQMNQETDPRMRMRAVYPFTARNSNEMSLRLGQIVTWRRDIDANWAEGANHIGEIGIFPKCYVRPAEEEQEQPQAVIPDRPKTPKITFDLDREEEWRQPVAHPVQDHPVYFEKPEERRHAPVREHIPVREHTVPIETSREEEWRQPIVRDHSIQIESRDKFYRDQAVREQSAPARHPAFSVDEPVAVHNGFHGGSGGRNAVEHTEINTYQHRHDDFRPNGLPHNPSSFEPSSSNQQRASTAPTTPHAGSSLANMIPKGSEVYRATFAYVPEKEDELELRIDDIVFVVEKCDDGWFIGTSLRDGRFGTFPGNYVVRH